MTVDILSYLICLSLGAGIGFVAAGIRVVASDKKQQPHGIRAGKELPGLGALADSTRE
jgi:hypothetical protein